MKDRKLITFERESSPIEATLNHELELRKQHKDGNWKPIRIKADYSNMKVTFYIYNKDDSRTDRFHLKETYSLCFWFLD